MTAGEVWNWFYASVNSIEVNTVSSVYKLVLSMLLGGLIGYERKRRGQSAGVRTFSLIAMGSTLAMILSIYVPQEYMGLKNGDPGRIAAQVVTGIGFLGAGAIIQMKGSVRGLTTAAGIWMVAAIGLSVGVGMYVISVLATALVMIILVALDKIEHKTNFGTELTTLKLTLDGIVDNIDDYRNRLKAHRIQITRYNIEYRYSDSKTEMNLLILIPEGVDLLSIVDELRGIRPTLAMSVSNQNVG